MVHCVFFRNFSILFKLLSLLCTNIDKILLNPFNFHKIDSDVLTSISDTSNLSLLCFFYFFSLAISLQIFLLLSKSQLLVLLIFSVVSLLSFHLSLVFIISFLPLALGLVCPSFSLCYYYFPSAGLGLLLLVKV